ncbi:MAG: OB-fold domain-containing protein [Candidatus Hydrogenedentota bacterium]
MSGRVGTGYPPSDQSPLPIFKCACGYGTLLDRPYCPKCHDALQHGFTGPFGVVLSWTIVHVAATEEAHGPYGLAMVGLESGINAMARFDVGDPLEIGDHVFVTLEENKMRYARKAPSR